MATRSSSERLSTASAGARLSVRPSVSEEATRSLQVTAFRCEPLADIEPQALGLTYFFDAVTDGGLYSVTIAFSGRRVGVKGKPRPKDIFEVTETVERLVPGSGRLAITTRVADVAPGEWQVTATPVKDRRTEVRSSRSAPQRWPRLPVASASGATGYAPVIEVRAPGARLGAWPALVGLGVAVGLVLQALLATHAQLPVTRVLGVSLAASLVGLLGAKGYYLGGHHLMRRFLPAHRDDERPAVWTAGM
ncbi:MAG: hypothetical protein M0Z42_22220, partial [Actinomycetota bacterium]|nr:hypothetical protein [Actinomycetota bacterium]